MGGGLALLFAEHGIHVSVNDPSEDAMDRLLDMAKTIGLKDYLGKHADYESLCESLGSPKVFFLSLPHGAVGDSVIEGLHPFLTPGDLFVDCANEHWENTQRRQGKMIAQGVQYVGCGVSGGYQSARRGPSMCPGGEDKAIGMILPMLEKVAAKDGRGRPCVAKVGEGGAGHYIKMVHNGIEHGMMSAISEAWSIMERCIGMKFDEIGNILAKWNSEGELRNCFLVDIGAQICRQKDREGTYVLGKVQDKVVQDVDGSEGTGVWSTEEAVHLHVPAATLSTAHYLRLASADRAQRKAVKGTFGGEFPIGHMDFEKPEERETFLEALRQAVYVTCLASFVQGILIIDRANRLNGWDINFAAIIQVWRAGCIIQADHIADMLESIFSCKGTDNNLLDHPSIAKEMRMGFDPLRRVVSAGVGVNAVIPSLSATLEYLKYSTLTSELPTSFYEAELDYFGKHMFDIKGEGDDAGKPETGSHHFEWRSA
ncbi:MAG: hypothetical protein M1817_002216 [Caeruleum heppii]|nr:MAG: hypothetical protein M1817_002216 [Caeruleum heppii]